jgi:hypothetical protein
MLPGQNASKPPPASTALVAAARCTFKADR